MDMIIQTVLTFPGILVRSFSFVYIYFDEENGRMNPRERAIYHKKNSAFSERNRTMPFIRRGTLCVRKTQQPRKGCAPPVAACCAAGCLISLSRAKILTTSKQAAHREHHLLSIVYIS